MAIYHLSAKPVSRGKGQSVVHKAAYNARTQLYDQRMGKKTKNYRNEGPIIYEHIYAPAHAPAWMLDRGELWNHVEKLEVRKDARLAREVDVALPHELTDQQHEELLQRFVCEAFVEHGMIADVAIHTATMKGDRRNCHAHILLATRSVTPEGFDPKKNRDWNKVETLRSWRELWSRTCNSFLEQHGHAARISHVSYKESGITQVPTKHVGARISRMEARGIRTRRGDYLRANKSNPEFLEK